MSITEDRVDYIAYLGRAIDEKALRTRGPCGAIIAAPSEASAVRRASLALGWHRVLQTLPGGRFAFPARVAPHDVVAALGTFRLLNRGGVRR